VEVLKPWESRGRAVALDSTTLQANGGVWHKKDREAGIVPHSSIDTEAGWTKSGWHGWVYGWKLHLAICVFEVWIPLYCRLTPANTADNEVAPHLIEQLPDEARFVLGDIHYNAPNVREACQSTQRFLVASKRGAYPHTDDGVEVRRIFHKLPSMANENFTMSISRPSSRCTGKFPPRAGSTLSVSLWVRCWSTNWLSCTAMSETWTSIVG
jgi:hypothetical protein